MSGLTISNPIRFEKVINSSRVIPGDVLHLRGGIYKGYWKLNIGGTKEQPVIIKSYNKEKVTIDGSLTFARDYLRIQDVEITDSNPDRTQITDGISMNVRGCELIGCFIHDLHNSGANWFGPEGRITECFIKDNGYIDTDKLGHGHAIYSHNHQGGTHWIERNLLGDQYGKYSIHLYSGGANYLKDFSCIDNVIFGNPVHTGGGLGLIDFLYQGNIQFGDYCQQGRYGYDHQNQNGQILDNLFIRLTSYTVNQDCNLEWLNLIESGNTVWNGQPSNRAGYTVEPEPRSWSKFIPFTLSERWSGIQVMLQDGVFDAKVL